MEPMNPPDVDTGKSRTARLVDFLRDVKTLRKMRRVIRNERTAEGYCMTCGGRAECQKWCWGPRLWPWVRTALRSDVRLLRLLMRWYRFELRWAGVEPWHRYEADIQEVEHA